MADEGTNSVSVDSGDGGQPAGEGPVTPPSGGEETTQPEGGRTFTQAELDQIVKDRLDRERKKYGDYKDLQAAAAKLKEIEEAQLSETERLQKKLAEAEAKAVEAAAQARETTVKSALIAAAARLNFQDPEDAYKLIPAGEVKYNDDGSVANADDLVKKLAEARKYLIKGKAAGLEPFDPNAAGGPLRETDEQKRQRIYGGGGLWSGVNPEEHGGGVIWPKGMPDQK